MSAVAADQVSIPAAAVIEACALLGFVAAQHYVLSGTTGGFPEKCEDAAAALHRAAFVIQPDALHERRAELVREYRDRLNSQLEFFADEFD